MSIAILDHPGDSEAAARFREMAVNLPPERNAEWELVKRALMGDSARAERDRLRGLVEAMRIEVSASPPLLTEEYILGNNWAVTRMMGLLKEPTL